MSYHTLLQKVHGKAFDIKLFIIFFFNGIPNGLITCTIVILFFTPPKQHCKLPDYAVEAMQTYPSMINLTMDYFIPRDKNVTFNQCMKYNRSYDDFVSFWNNTYNHTSATLIKANETTITCEGDKEYFETYGKISAVMEFDWTCDRSFFKPIASALYMAGVTAGTTMGYLSDRLGRRPVFVVFNFLMCAWLLLLSFANSIAIFLVLLFCAGCSGMVNYLVGFVLGTECTIPERRNFLSISSFVSFSLSYGITSLIGFLTPDWRWHMRVLGLVGILYIPNIWLVPESPRWLMANGKIDKAKKVLKTMAKYNGKSHVWREVEGNIEEATKKLIEEKETENIKKKSRMYAVLREAFTKTRMLIIFMITSFAWFSVALAYYGISLSVQALSGNLYVNNTMMGLMELPGYALAYLAVKYIGRPLSHGGSMILSGLFILLGAFLSSGNKTLATVAGMIGKSLNCGAFYLVYIHTAEIFPTVTRNTFVSVSSAAGRIGSIVAPYFVYLGDLYGMYVPYLSLSIITCISGFFTLFGLPETKNIELPESVTDSLKLKTLLSKHCKKQNDESLFTEKIAQSTANKTEDV